MSLAKAAFPSVINFQSYVMLNHFKGKKKKSLILAKISKSNPPLRFLPAPPTLASYSQIKKIISCVVLCAPASCLGITTWKYTLNKGKSGKIDLSTIFLNLFILTGG